MSDPAILHRAMPAALIRACEVNGFDPAAAAAFVVGEAFLSLPRWYLLAAEALIKELPQHAEPIRRALKLQPGWMELLPAYRRQPDWAAKLYAVRDTVADVVGRHPTRAVVADRGAAA